MDAQASFYALWFRANQLTHAASAGLVAVLIAMDTLVPTCQACEKRPGSISDSSDDAEEPYIVCSDCHTRLHAMALRPLEWYNLAKRHGWFTHLLHDDFYLEDGTADQPNEPVLDARLHPIPLFEDVRKSAATLLDWSITRWNLSDREIHAWQALDREDAFAELTRRFATTRNAGIKECVLNIVSFVPNDRAADFVRYCWSEYPESIALGTLVRASAKFLPFHEAFDRAVSALAALAPRERRDRMYCLKNFSSPAVLDWIEENYFDPATDTWGYLASRCCPTWNRMQKWLAMGRPFSLIALDTLGDIADPRPRSSSPAGLIEPPAHVDLVATLNDYQQRDPVPRVANIVGWILKNSSKLTIEGTLS